MLPRPSGSGDIGRQSGPGRCSEKLGDRRKIDFEFDFRIWPLGDLQKAVSMVTFAVLHILFYKNFCQPSF